MGCPKKGDVASDRCYSYLKSWDEYEDKCIAPEDAQCMKLNSGAWGCVFPSVGCDTPIPATINAIDLSTTRDVIKIVSNVVPLVDSNSFAIPTETLEVNADVIHLIKDAMTLSCITM